MLVQLDSRNPLMLIAVQTTSRTKADSAGGTRTIASRYPPKAIATVVAVAAPPRRITSPTPKAAQSAFGTARLTYTYSAPAAGNDVVISAYETPVRNATAAPIRKLIQRPSCASAAAVPMTE